MCFAFGRACFPFAVRYQTPYERREVLFIDWSRGSNSGQKIKVLRGQDALGRTRVYTQIALE